MHKRNRRLRKKLHLGEFQQLGFEVSISLRPDLGTADVDQFLDEFILEAIEKKGLAFGGGTEGGFITTWERGSASEEHRAIVEAWLNQRQEVAAVSIGPLVDAWYTEAEPHSNPAAQPDALGSRAP
jgi:uncharacterized protein YggL (DUF469 family)